MPESRLTWPTVDRQDRQARLFDPDGELEFGRGEFRGMEFLHVRARSIINEVPAASRMPFRHTINAYRGCSHACVYCFARPTHEYLGLNAGEDFERRIVVKINAVELLRAETEPGRWSGDHIAMGTNTDPYQRCEAKYRLTRGIVEVLTDRANPFSILTKNTLVLGDLDLLAEAARRTDVTVNFSIGSLDEEVWRQSEPNTPHPRKRVEAVARLNEAGISSGVLVAPILPGLSDRPDQIEEVVEACLHAGARFVSPILLHLRPGVREQYMSWLERNRPDQVASYRKLYPRSYAPKSVQRDLSDRVSAIVARRRGPQPPANPRNVTETPSRPDPDEEQLGLNL